jgi:hypothetical protein
MDYECARLIELYNTEKMEFIRDFHGFDYEYIVSRIEDIVHELTNIDIINQEPIYITKSAAIGLKEPVRSDAWVDDSPPTKQYGNRLFTVLFFLSEGEVTFPQVKLNHKMKAGDALVWNNVVEAGRVIDSINQVSNDTYYIKKWVREKPFV